MRFAVYARYRRAKPRGANQRWQRKRACPEWGATDYLFGQHDECGKKDATQSDYTISNVQKLLFGLRTSAINEVSTGSLKAYPNPAKEILNLDGISKMDNLRLYNLTGSELSVSYSLVNKGLQISTGNLPQGIYLLQVNSQTIKFQKR